jgi:glucosamine--fructose-6-phosphate aminotransferase (isomerizing)
MAREMGEQPSRLRALIGRENQIGELVRALVPPGLRGVTIVARGSSDHAAIYGRYLLELATGKPVSLAAPSLHTLYHAEVDYTGQLVIAISQSGRTPEIVTTLRRLREAGGRALAITNDLQSELASEGDVAIELGAGEERAVPATKTVLTQLLLLALIARALGPLPFSTGDLAALPDEVQRVLDDPDPATAAAERLQGRSRLVVAARGLTYPAALETALKIEEICSVLTSGWSAADLRHGPIAAVTPDVPVVAIHTPGPGEDDMHRLIGDLHEREAQVLTVSPEDGSDLPLPSTTPDALAAITAIVRGQQLALALGLALGLDPDHPARLAKVTET